MIRTVTTPSAELPASPPDGRATTDPPDGRVGPIECYHRWTRGAARRSVVARPARFRRSTMTEGAREHLDHQRPGDLVTARPPLAYGTADAPRRAGQWWFVLAVLLAGAVSFGGVWAVFEYRARRSGTTAIITKSPPATAGQSGLLPPLTGPLASPGLSPGLAPP